MIAPRPRLFFLPMIALLFLAGAQLLCGEDLPVEKVFSAFPFDQWVREGPRVKIPWKVQIQPYGLSLHQRLRARIVIELKRRELVKLPPDDRLAGLIEVADAAGQQFRDYLMFRMKEMGAEIKKGEIEVFWK